MPTSTKPQVVGLVVILMIGIAVSGFILAPSFLNPTVEPDTLTVHLLETECVIIEYNETRLYIDPWYLLENYTALLADVILITHPHFDHYNETTINLLQKDDTVHILPANMSAEVSLHDGIGVAPGDVVQVGDFTITAFYEYGPGHPREANWTSYLIEVNGFTIFHAGDSMNITEYTQLNGIVDLAFLPVYTYDYSTVSSIEMIQPGYFVPMHFDEGYNQIYIDAYGDDIAAVSDCQILVIDYGTSITFEI